MSLILALFIVLVFTTAFLGWWGMGLLFRGKNEQPKQNFIMPELDYRALQSRLSECEKGAAELTLARNRDRVALNEHYEARLSAAEDRAQKYGQAVDNLADKLEQAEGQNAICLKYHHARAKLFEKLERAEKENDGLHRELANVANHRKWLASESQRGWERVRESWERVRESEENVVLATAKWQEFELAFDRERERRQRAEKVVEAAKKAGGLGWYWAPDLREALRQYEEGVTPDSK